MEFVHSTKMAYYVDNNNNNTQAYTIFHTSGVWQVLSEKFQFSDMTFTQSKTPILFS